MSGDKHDIRPGDFVELNSGGPTMTVVETTTPGRDMSSTDAVGWWRAKDGRPQIMQIDVVCLHLVGRGGGLPL